ncbi:MAG: dihydrolipoamide acetyltransferase family protein [Bacteroidota bacterium]
MATAVIMPKQGQSVESCILTEWYKNTGDKVSKGDLLFAYETDKASFEEEAQEDGVLLAQFYEAGDEVPVLINMGVIGAGGDSVDEFRPDGAAPAEAPVEEPAEVPVSEPTATEPAATEQPAAAAEAVPAATAAGGKSAISPRARRLAKERRVAIEGIVGSGPGGRIIERDIEAEIASGKRLTPLAQKRMEGEGLAVPGEGKAPYGKITSKELVEASQKVPAATAQEAVSEDYREIPLSNVRKIIAGAMYSSLQNSAQLTHHLSANASGMLQLRKEVKKRVADGYQNNITLNDMVCYAVIRALKAYPEANAQYHDGVIRQFNRVNLGLAVDTERGLLVPALPGADDFSLPGLSSQLGNLVASARGGSVSPDLLAPQAASFTVSNLGNYGVEMFTPVINLPQVAILGVNTIIQRPTVLKDGSFGFQPFIGLSLTYDHRAIDGGPATMFLAEIKNQVEQLSPELL